MNKRPKAMASASPPLTVSAAVAGLYAAAEMSGPLNLGRNSSALLTEPACRSSASPISEPRPSIK